MATKPKAKAKVQSKANAPAKPKLDWNKPMFRVGGKAGGYWEQGGNVFDSNGKFMRKF